MNAPFEIADLALPINPEICWRISVALIHTTWQVFCLWVLVYMASRQKRFSLHSRFQFSFACLLLAGCLPFLNYLAQGKTALPASVSSAAHEFDASGSVSLFRPSELASIRLSQNDSTAELPGSILSSSTDVASNRDVELAPSLPGYWKVSTTTVMVLAYFLGVAFMLLRLGQAIGKQHRLKATRDATFITKQSHPDLFRAAKNAATSLHQTLATQITVYEGTGTAFVLGILRPVILVNASLLSGLTPEQLQQILVHELAHIYRLDPITQVIQRFVESILFFHPALWWISQEISQLREHCCDDLAAQSSSSAEFANTLLDCYFLQKDLAATQPELALPAIGKHTSQLTSRIEVLLNKEQVSKRSELRNYSLPLIARLVLASMFIATALTTLSTRSTAESLANQKSPEDQNPFAWIPVDDINDTTIEQPHLWFAGTRLAMQENVPQDISIEAMVDPGMCQFAQWHFGDSRSNRVALLVERDGAEVSRVFLDMDRDRNIEADEELSIQIHGGKVWIASLAAKVGEGDDLESVTRQIAIYPRKDRVRIRTLGFAKGEIEIAAQTYSVRRLDTDGDGIPVGNKDQLWVDLNSDGEFDQISERFNMADHLNVAGQRFIVRSDRIGHSLTLTPQTDLGQLIFNLELADKTATIEKLEGTLRDENGMLIAVRLTGEPISVPTGRYCLENLVLQVRDQKDATWRMTLSREFDMGWIEVSSGGTQQVSLLDGFEFTGAPIHEDDEYTGFQSHVIPQVYTNRGLAITDFVRLEKGVKQGHQLVDRLVKISAANSSVPKGQACSGFN